MEYTDDRQVLDALKIDSWKKLSKEKFLKYVAIIPDVSEVVRLKVIEKLPESLSFTKDLVETMKSQQENIAHHNTNITTKIITSLDAIQKSLDSMGNQPNLSFEEKKYLVDKQMELAQIYVSLDSNNKKFLKILWGGVVVFGLVALTFVGTMLGVKFIGGKQK